MTDSREEDERVMKILAAVRRKPAEEREAYLRSACGGDEDLRREVADALSWEDRMGGFLLQPVAVIAGENPQPDFEVTAVQFPAGLVIGQYRIESKLGEGGMSTVWLALDTKLGRHVAIKFLSDDLANAEARRRFQREAQMASSLNHPHIVTVYDIGEFEGRQYLVTEYVDGGTLKDWIKDKPRTPKEVVELLTGVADGLAAAHQAGILHRDIKPLNILVARNGYAKLADFGVAKLAESSTIELAANSQEGPTRLGLILGTIAYMSPEQASGQPLDSRSDIFSFGVMLYEMLSGKRPFGGRTDLEVLKTVIHGELPPLSEEVPEAYRNVVEKALEKSPAERYQSMREMVVDLRRGQRSQRSRAPGVEEAIAPIGLRRGPTSPKVWLKIGVGILAIAAVVLGAIGIFRRLWPRVQPTQEQANLTSVPLTALAGQATSPAFSPDGSRIAFAWNGDPKDGTKDFDLYVKAVGSETLLRLTQQGSASISPAWSPDGTQIAFYRMAGSDTGIYVVPALGGSERKLRSTRMPSTNYSFIGGANVALVNWSPDGKWIAFADVPPGEEHSRVYLLSMETLEATQIPISPMCVGEGLPAFSHKGDYLAYWCFLSGPAWAVLYSLPLPGGQPKMIATVEAYPNGLAWSANDEKLVYSSYSVGNESSLSELGEVTVANGATKKLDFAGSAMTPTLSARGDKLAYASVFTKLNIRRRDLLHTESPGVDLIPSSRMQFYARYSPDGKRIVFNSFRSGVQGVWISDDDGSNLVQISNPHDASGSPQWSPDGNKIVFDSHPRERWEIYVADVAERKPRKLVTNISDLIRPYWSRDGKWIYFRSEQSGKAGVYRCLASGGDAVLLSKDIDGYDPQESFDGKTVYFASRPDKSILKRVPLPEQPDTQLKFDGFPRLRNYTLWTLSRTGIYFVSDEAPRSLRYFDFATKNIRTIFEVDTDFGPGLSVSPDGRWILYTQASDATGDIMLVDHFH
ncbi:protein kinase domain-containing protein [Tunturiibacter lichenicola]|uniref:protein kinase domain-containing protein n=1 Tax=Tunturiibacter lichenicola TaxID=2051959 RepID=UPI003D9BF546